MSLSDLTSDSQKRQNRWIFDYVAMTWMGCALTGVKIPGDESKYLQTDNSSQILGVWIANYEVIPTVFGKSPGWFLFNKCFLAYGTLMLLINWLLVRFTSNKLSTTWVSSTTTLPSCVPCSQPIPLRAHHCNLCKTCVLKHNHHCFFAACCIGFRNHRYFMAFVFWMFIGCSYSFLVATVYIMSDRWKGIGWYCYPFFPIAVAKALLGYMTGFEISYLLCYVSLLSAVFGSSFLFFQQFYLICTGRTSFEYKHKLKSPVGHLPISLLIRIVFGPLWLLQLFLPIGIFTQPLGDGLSWDYEGFKTE